MVPWMLIIIRTCPDQHRNQSVVLSTLTLHTLCVCSLYLATVKNPRGLNMAVWQTNAVVSRPLSITQDKVLQ